MDLRIRNEDTQDEARRTSQPRIDSRGQQTSLCKHEVSRHQTRQDGCKRVHTSQRQTWIRLLYPQQRLLRQLVTIVQRISLRQRRRLLIQSSIILQREIPHRYGESLQRNDPKVQHRRKFRCQGTFCCSRRLARRSLNLGLPYGNRRA